MLDNELICKLYTEDKKSIREIAEMFNTYPLRINRILKKSGVHLRDRSESGKLAIQNGRLNPPMLGKKRTSEEIANISKKVSEAWRRRDKEDRERAKDEARERWNAIPEETRKEYQTMAAKALRRAADEGSKMEKYIYEALTKAGVNVIMHMKGVVPGHDYEVDLFIPGVNLAVEIDGLQHISPIYGNRDLTKTQQFDQVKNGALIAKGIRVLRIKNYVNHNSMAVNNKVVNEILKVVKNIEAGQYKKTQMLMVVEIKND